MSLLTNARRVKSESWNEPLSTNATVSTSRSVSAFIAVTTAGLKAGKRVASRVAVVQAVPAPARRYARWNAMTTSRALPLASPIVRCAWARICAKVAS